MEDLLKRYQARVRTYSDTIRDMDKELISSRSKKASEDVNDLAATNRKLKAKQKELRQTESLLRKKELTEKEYQSNFTEKNNRICELENEVCRLRTLYEQAK